MRGTINASNLRARVTFQSRAVTNDGAGGVLGSWAAAFADKRAQLSPRLAGGPNAEQVIAQRLQGINLFDLWVRSDADTRTVSDEFRVVDARYTNRVFNIRAVTDPYEGGADQRRWLVMLAEQGVADG